jgi:hypothetical protein
MAYEQAKRQFRVGLIRFSTKMLLIAGLLPMICGGCSDEIPPPPGYLGTDAPKAPIQEAFTCDQAVNWRLPKERENTLSLRPSEIKTVTIYAAQSPISAEDVPAFIMDVDAHLLRWQFQALESTYWYFRLTVTDNDGLESVMSNERSNEQCF